MLVGVVAVYLQTKGLIGEPEMVLIAGITGVFTAIRTIDRFGEKAGAVDTGKVISAPSPTKIDVPSDQGVVN